MLQYLQLPLDASDANKYSYTWRLDETTEFYSISYQIDNKYLKFWIEPKFKTEEERSIFRLIITSLMNNEKMQEDNQQLETGDLSSIDVIMSEDSSYINENDFEVIY